MMGKRATLSGEVAGIFRGNEPPASEPASQPEASKPAPKAERRKCTYHLDPHDVTLLEQERHRRRMDGKVANYSALVREAIRKAYGADDG